MPQDVVTALPEEGPNRFMRSGLESLFGLFAPEGTSAAEQSEKVTNLLNFTPLGVPQEAFDIGKGLGDTLQGGDPTMLAMSMIPGKAAEGVTKVAKELDIPAAVKEAQMRLRGYHGSPQKGLSEILANPPARQFDNGTSALGAFFAPHEGGAKRYAGDAGQIYSTDLNLTNPYEMPVSEFLRLQDPTTASDGAKLSGEQWASRLEELKGEGAALRERLAAAGHDGVIIRGPNGDIKEISSFNDVSLPAADDLVPAVKAAQKKLTYKHPISGVKLKTPIEEMQVDTKPFGEMVEEKQLHPEWLLGKTVVPMRGDPAAAGISITGLGGRPFTKQVDMWGGAGYPQMKVNYDKGLGWASQPGAAATQGNRAAKLYKEGEGKDVVGIYQKMSPRSTAFNTFTPEILHQMFMQDRSKIANVDVAEFDRIMREVPMKINKKGVAERPAYPDWPGLDNLTPEYLRKAKDGKVRNKMFDLMDSKAWQDKGFPNAGYANFAGTDKRLLNKETNTSGTSVVTYDPLGRTLDNSGHPTYSRGVLAKYEGTLPDLPLDVLYEGYRETGGKGGGPISNSHLEKFLMTKPPSLLVDDKTLERVMKYLRSQDGFKWGIGGAVAAGLLSQEQADQINQEAGRT
jgi:hypothetical protein